jgi:hypothetical protein
VLLVGCLLRWPGDLKLKSAEGVAARKTAGIVALHWSSLDGACCSVKPESELIRLVPLKSSPTCSCRWLHCDLENVPREHANCTTPSQSAAWSESPC